MCSLASAKDGGLSPDTRAHRVRWVSVLVLGATVKRQGRGTRDIGAWAMSGVGLPARQVQLGLVPQSTVNVVRRSQAVQELGQVDIF